MRRVLRLTVIALTAALVLVSAALGGRPSSHWGTARRSATAIVVQNIKEVNYYPATGGWTYMWSDFQPSVIDRDFARIHALGANTVRIFVQPLVFGYPTVNPVMAGRLSTVVGLAAKNSLWVHLTLFDWWSKYSDIAGGEEWASSLLSPYKDDARIAVVELHNEIDPTNPAAVTWVSTMLPYLAKLMPGTLRTVSVPSVSRAVVALLISELSNTPPDFWDYHYYGPAADAYAQLKAVQALASPRPLFIGETGFSTTGTAQQEPALQQAQATYYQGVFNAAANLGLPPPAPWTLNDFAQGAIPPSQTASNPAQYGYGLYELNGTAKPAAAVVEQAFTGGKAHWRQSSSGQRRRSSQVAGALKNKLD